MPTYIVRAAAGLLSATSKAEIARSITRTHTSVTGAEGFFAQVLFREVAAGDCFLGGAPLDTTHVFVQGHIRAGRSAVERAELIRGIVPSIAGTLGIPRYAVWVYISELPARAMAEYGHILPEPGDEAAWLAGLPDEDRARLAAFGRSAPHYD